MAIQVTCPKCLKRFQVSDKFAGRTGPCPSCKTTIKVPELNEEVTIHAPEDDAPKDRSGQSVLKPIKREETDVTKRGLIISGVSVVGCVIMALVMGMLGLNQWWAIGLGALIVAPPIVWVGYSVLRESELAPYVGSELRNRVLVCSGLFPALWLIYMFLPPYLFDLNAPNEISYLFFGLALAAMLVVGAFVSMATFEFEFTTALAHAGLYIVVTMVLAFLAGMTLAGVEVEEIVRSRPLVDVWIASA
ncbi:MAG: hypothetical protein AAF664_25035 [Planctomycetota bacterium]